MQAVLMRVESHYKIFLLILLFLLNSSASFLPLYGSPLPCISCLASGLDRLDQVTVLACLTDGMDIREDELTSPQPVT